MHLDDNDVCIRIQMKTTGRNRPPLGLSFIWDHGYIANSVLSIPPKAIYWRVGGDLLRRSYLYESSLSRISPPLACS